MAVNLMCKCGATLTVTADMAGKMGARLNFTSALAAYQQGNVSAATRRWLRP